MTWLDKRGIPTQALVQREARRMQRNRTAGRGIMLVLVLLIAAMTVINLPDIKRYLRIRNM